MLGTLWLAGCGVLGDSAPDRDWPEPSPALFEITSPEGETGWLFGTMHSLPDGLEWRTEALDAAFAEADMLLVEIADLDDPAASEIFFELAETPGQPRLSLRVEQGERADLLALMERAGASERDFADMESWAAALSLASAVRANDPQNGADRAFIYEANDRGIEVRGFESYRSQLGLFDGLSQEAQDDLLYSVARGAQEQNPDELVETWLSGDLVRIEQETEGELVDNTELREVLVARRNRTWQAALTDLVEAGREPFVAVGAGHLVGDDGLPSLLQAEGYTVVRIQ